MLFVQFGLSNSYLFLALPLGIIIAACGNTDGDTTAGDAAAGDAAAGDAAESDAAESDAGDQAIQACLCEGDGGPCRPCTSEDNRCNAVGSLLRCDGTSGCLKTEECPSTGGYPHCEQVETIGPACVHCDPPAPSECDANADCDASACGNAGAVCRQEQDDCPYCPEGDCGTSYGRCGCAP